MIRETQEILDLVVETHNDGNCYYVLHGGDNKVWILPSNYISRGLEMYSSSSLKGKLIKVLLPKMIKSSIFRNFFKIEKLYLNIKPEIYRLFTTIAQEPIVSMYLGNTIYRQNKKIIIQISNKNEVLGYAKFGTDQCVKDAFAKEVEVLDFLAKAGIKGVPQILSYTNIGNLSGFIQSTSRTNREKTIYTLEKEHWDFMKQIKSLTGTSIDYSSSSYSTIIHLFKESLKEVQWNCKDLLEQCINQIDKHYIGKKMQVAFSHGDFTPWNVCYSEGNLFVFDFEYSEKNFPLGMDIFHYITQVGILIKKNSAEQIFEDVMGYSQELNEFAEELELSYMQYLIYIIAFYYGRMGERLNEDDRSFKIWIQLIEMCIRRNNERK